MAAWGFLSAGPTRPTHGPRHFLHGDWMPQKSLRVNDQIRAATVRLIDEKGEQAGVLPAAEALRMAKEADLDLVEVAPDSDPPVCKIIDFGKYKYRQKKRLQQGKHHSGSQLKEIRLHPKTGDHDIAYRAAHARGFLAQGHRVLVNVLFKGRELAHAELGREILGRFAQALEDVAKVDQPPKMEGRKMSVTLSPKGQ